MSLDVIAQTPALLRPKAVTVILTVADGPSEDATSRGPSLPVFWTLFYSLYLLPLLPPCHGIIKFTIHNTSQSMLPPFLKQDLVYSTNLPTFIENNYTQNISECLSCARKCDLPCDPLSDVLTQPYPNFLAFLGLALHSSTPICFCMPCPLSGNPNPPFLSTSLIPKDHCQGQRHLLHSNYLVPLQPSSSALSAFCTFSKAALVALGTCSLVLASMD